MIRLYNLPLQLSIDEFLCEEWLVKQLTGQSAPSREALVIVEEGQDAFIGLHIRDDLLAALHSADARELNSVEELDTFVAVLEGVSHLLYVLHKAEREEPVSLLELEVQAEVDKYLTCLLPYSDKLAWEERHEDRSASRLVPRSRHLRERLFIRLRYHDDERTEAGERYREANRLALRYVSYLERYFLAQGRRQAELESEVRSFYRLRHHEKLTRAMVA